MIPFRLGLVTLRPIVIYGNKLKMQAESSSAIQISFDGTSMGKVSDINVFLITLGFDDGRITKPLIVIPQVRLLIALVFRPNINLLSAKCSSLIQRVSGNQSRVYPSNVAKNVKD